MNPSEEEKYRPIVWFTAGRTATLTDEEISRLSKIRAQYDGHPECIELELDERRLTFARWLVNSGSFREDM
jgi:hypothetical protein